MREFMETKICNKCNVEKPCTKEHFSEYSNNTKEGKKICLRHICKTCRSNQNKNRPKKKNSAVEDQTILKTCRGCKKDLPQTLKFFYPASSNKNGLNSICKNCHLDKYFPNRISRERRVQEKLVKNLQQEKEKVLQKEISKEKFKLKKAQNRRNNPVEECSNSLKMCKTCLNNYPRTLEFFFKDKEGLFGLRASCKSCTKKGKKTTKNKERCARQQRDWRTNNPEKYSFHRKKRIESGYFSNYCKQKRLSDPHFVVKERLRANLRGAFKRFSTKGKAGKSKYYRIDYDAIFNHIGPCPGLNSEYHIDHIIPISAFNFDDPYQIYLAFHPLNHQWLEKTENLKKSDYFNLSDMENFILNVKEYDSDHSA